MRKIIILLVLATLPISLYSQWIQVTSPSTNTLYSLYFTNPTTGYLSGSLNGIVIKTTNGGTSWIFQNTGATSTFYYMYFWDALTGTVSGSSKQVIKTTNGGLNWDIKTSGSGTIYSLAFPTAVGYAVGGSPAVIDKTTDSGNNWFNIVSPTSNAIKGSWFGTGSLGWICGTSGTIWKTTDGCISWIPQLQSTSYNFEEIRFHGTSIGYVIGSNGTMLKTTDGGSIWSPINSGTTNTLYDIFFLNSVTGWAIGANGTIVRTTDSGNNWYVQASPTSNTLNAIHMIDGNTGYIVGSDGVLLKTTNGGGAPVIPFFQKIAGGPIPTTSNASNQCAFGDYDNDGLIDLVVSTYNDSCLSCTYPLLLFRNVGTGSFARIMTGPIATVTSRTFGVSWGDYDNDSKLDLFVSVGFDQNNLLFHNEGGGNFTQITSGSIVNDGGSSRGCAWVDYDRDGWLDLFVCNQDNQNNCLYHNNGNGTFTKVTSGSIVNDLSFTRGCSWGDYDNDMWPDLCAVNYSGQNDMLFNNNGNGTFTKVMSGPIVNDGLWGSGCCWGDYDNDGYLDLYVTNNNQPNRLYHNEGNGNFTLVSGGPSSESGYTYGASWGDYDSDGYLDLFMAKQFTMNALYKNIMGQNFVKITNEPPTLEGGNSIANAWGDYNNDGKLDLIVTNNYLSSVNYLYLNVGNTQNYLVLKLKGCVSPTVRSNYNGIGARIKVRDGNNIFIREVTGGMGIGSQDMFWQHFGLGSITNIDSVIIYWPSSNIQTFTNVASNQILLIDECTVGGISPNSIPVSYSLEQNFPNPFNPRTIIGYSLKKLTPVLISVYDITGRFIRTLIDATQPAGNYSVEFEGSSISSGIYIYKIQTEEFTAQKKMVLIK